MLTALFAQLRCAMACAVHLKDPFSRESALLPERADLPWGNRRIRRDRLTEDSCLTKNVLLCQSRSYCIFRMISASSVAVFGSGYCCTCLTTLLPYLGHWTGSALSVSSCCTNLVQCRTDSAESVTPQTQR